jgi:L-2-hydroxyglutarate oxidase
MQKYDVVIIGGGVVGLGTALALSENKKIKIKVIEAEKELAAHQTGNNSGVIHSGLYYKPGSLKARNCVEGRELLYRFCKEHDIAYDNCGKLVVAVTDDEIPGLKKLYERGQKNNLKGLKWLEGKEINEYEPHVNGIAALLVPETGIVNYKDVTDKYAEIVRANGHEVETGCAFSGLHRNSDGLIVQTNRGDLHTKYLINCGGLQSDRIAKKCGVEPGLKIIPFRGEYYKLKAEKYHLVKNLIYPVPDPEFPFLGVHFTRMIEGGVEAGPNAVLAFKREGYSKFSFSLKDTIETFTYPGFIKLAGQYMSMGMHEFYRSYVKSAFVKALQRLIPEITGDDIVPGGAGIRAQALERNGLLTDDFRIVETEDMIHVLNAPSPAATASISIGKTISQMAEKNFDLN